MIDLHIFSGTIGIINYNIWSQCRMTRSYDITQHQHNLYGFSGASTKTVLTLKGSSHLRKKSTDPITLGQVK